MLMKKIFVSLLVIMLLVGCTNNTTGPTPTVEATLPSPSVHLTATPDAQAAAEAYLAAWKLEQYDVMYDHLTALTRDAIPLEEFEKSHRQAAIAMTLKEMNYQILSSLVNPNSAQVSYRVSYDTTLLGEISRETTMGMALNDGIWKVQWEAGMILPELSGGNVLELKYKIPARGNIYDQDAHALVAQEDAV